MSLHELDGLLDRWRARRALEEQQLVLGSVVAAHLDESGAVIVTSEAGQLMVRGVQAAPGRSLDSMDLIRRLHGEGANDED